MNPVGNDVVDLKAVGNVGKSGDTRFMRRVFTPDEQQAIYRSAHPDKLLWAFWAAKETAYKAAAKTDPDITSAPGRYPVFLDLEYGTGAMRGNVSTPGGPVAVKIRFHEEYVHCVGLGGGLGIWMKSTGVSPGFCRRNRSRCGSVSWQKPRSPNYLAIIRRISISSAIDCPEAGVPRQWSVARG